MGKKKCIQKSKYSLYSKILNTATLLPLLLLLKCFSFQREIGFFSFLYYLQSDFLFFFFLCASTSNLILFLCLFWLYHQLYFRYFWAFFRNVGASLPIWFYLFLAYFLPLPPSSIWFYRLFYVSLLPLLPFLTWFYLFFCAFFAFTSNLVLIIVSILNLKLDLKFWVHLYGTIIEKVMVHIFPEAWALTDPIWWLSDLKLLHLFSRTITFHIYWLFYFTFLILFFKSII